MARERGSSHYVLISGQQPVSYFVFQVSEVRYLSRAQVAGSSAQCQRIEADTVILSS